MATLEQLRDRWRTDDGKKRLAKVIEAAKKKEDWAHILKGFPYVEEVENRRDLRGAHSSEAHPSGAHRSGADLRGADLNGANLSGAHLFEADLSGAVLRFAKLIAADLIGADLKGACFDHVSLYKDQERSTTNFAGAPFNRRTSFLGVDISQTNWAGNPRLERHIKDQQWLDAWRNKNKRNRFLYWVWLISCDCGRSFWLWFSISFGMAIAFGLTYWVFATRFIMGYGRTLADASWFAPLYYSIVTFTTLGFGDVTPKPGDGWMQGVVTIEVALGYIMLGGLISIFANKLARRS